MSKIRLILIFFSLSWAVSAYAEPNPHTKQIELGVIMGQKASIIIDGKTSKTLAVGETYQGITLQKISGQHATFRVTENGSTRNMVIKVGQAPVKVEESTNTPQTQQAKPQRERHGELTFQRARDDHFYTTATVNRQKILFMVDTGASAIAVSLLDAKKIGLDYTKAEPIQTRTANGITKAYRTMLPSLTIGRTTVYNLPVTIIPNMTGSALLGQAFLNKFHITIKDDQMFLKLR